MRYKSIIAVAALLLGLGAALGAATQLTTATAPKPPTMEDLEKRIADLERRVTALEGMSKPVINVDVNGKVEHIRFSGTDMSFALALVSEQFKKNIVASKNVKGTVTIDLYNVTFNQALEAICGSNRLDYTERGNFIYIYTLEELDAVRKGAITPATKP